MRQQSDGKLLEKFALVAASVFRESLRLLGQSSAQVGLLQVTLHFG
jgi:hypothetical protein